jgi:hypothetical protein
VAAGTVRRTVDLLLVNVLDGIVVGVAGRDGVVERVVEMVVGRDEVVEEACAAVGAPADWRLPAAGGQVGGV